MSSPDHPFYAPGLRIPRFLFRGFTRYSGGGGLSVNNVRGIIPHGFLCGYDTETELGKKIDTEKVQRRAKMHVCTRTDLPTPFSSWSHDWLTALPFACSRREQGTREQVWLNDVSDHGCIAVLDTWAWGDEDMLRNRIFHVPQLRLPRVRDIPQEWLIWGPISGPAYRCVSLATIREAANCPRWPNFLAYTQPCLQLQDLRESLLIAGCFQTDEDGSSDVMLTVAAAELACRQWGAPKGISPEPDLETNPVRPLWPPQVSQAILDTFALGRPRLSGRPLVHGQTAVEWFPRVQLMYTLLRMAEARWKVPEPGAPWAPVDWREALRYYIPEGGCRPSSCPEHQHDHKS